MSWDREPETIAILRPNITTLGKDRYVLVNQLLTVALTSVH